MFLNRHTHANTKRQAFVQLNKKWHFLLSPTNLKIIHDQTALTGRVCFLNGKVIKV